MHHININSKDTAGKVSLDISNKPIGRFIPVSKTVNNCPNTKLPWKCSKVDSLTPPYVYCTKSYKWLANAFANNSPGLFKPTECKELTKLINMYHKCTSKEVDKATEEQIWKDIVRTFPNNTFFDKNRSGYYSMYKVLAAYSNLDEVQRERYR